MDRRSWWSTIYDHRSTIYICLGLAAATLLVFAQVSHFAFINLDDDRIIYENPMVKSGLHWDTAVWAFTTIYVDYWQPITWLSHLLDVQFFGMDPGWHHLTSVFIHILNALLLFLVLRRMTGAVWRSAAVAVLFAIHPLRAESVAWVTERKDVLGGFFWWLTVWAYIGYVRQTEARSQKPETRRGAMRYLLVIVLYAMALMSKPVTMTMPFFLLLLDYWPLERSRFSTGVKLIREKLPLFMLTAAAIALTFKAQHTIGATDMTGPLAFSVRAANAAVSYAMYLFNMVWPYPLVAIYPFDPSLPIWKVAISALVLAGITALAIRKGARYPYLIVGWFWYLGVLLPVSGLLQMGFQSRADRFTYTALTGVFVMVVWSLHDLTAGWRFQKRAAVIAAIVVFTALGLRAHSQVSYWRDGLTLFGQNVAVTPNNPWALNSLGWALDKAGRPDDAKACFSKAFALNPQKGLESLDNLGVVLARQGKLQEALGNLTEAERRWPQDARARCDRAMVLIEMGRLQEAKSEFVEALRLGHLPPDLAVSAQSNLGWLLSQEGKTREAIALYQQALSIDPSFRMARRNLAIALVKAGRTEEAVMHLSLLVSRDPADSEARSMLAQLISTRGGHR